MMKLITVDGQDFIIEKYGKNWYARVKGLLTIKPTIKEIKADILQELITTKN